MKKLLLLLLTIVMVFTFSSCGYYTEAEQRPGGSHNSDTETDDGGDDDPTVDVEPELADMFTVMCMSGGRPVEGSVLKGCSVRWSSYDGSLFVAEFDKTGVAACPDSEYMDGNYNIELVLTESVADKYTYNRDLYTATNDNKHISITLYAYIELTVDEYKKPEKIPERVLPGNVYCATIDMGTRSTDYKRSFLMAAGFTVETWASVIDDMLDPTITGYHVDEISGYVNPGTRVVCAGGGTSGSFTENVKMNYTLYPKLAQYGCTLYEITVERAVPIEKNHEDVKVFFMVSVGGGSARPDPGEEPVTKRPVREADLLVNTSSPDIIGPTTVLRYSYGADGILHGDQYALFKKGMTDAEGNQGDGYYHRIERAADGSIIYKEVLFALITKDCQVLETDSGCGFLFGRISVRCNGYDYSDFFGDIDTTTGNRTPKNYAAYANDNGAHPVTAELKDFLQDYASSSGNFNDGDGWFEDRTLNRHVSLKAAEDDMWLFCCCYYSGYNEIVKKA